MMKHMIALLIVTIVSSILVQMANSEEVNRPPEYVEYHDGYNELLFNALGHLETGHFADAKSSLEKASIIPLFERANMHLSALRAWAEYGAGNIDVAKRLLLKAELELLVFSRIVRCHDYEEPRYLESPGNIVFDKYPYDLREEVAYELCWVGYQGYLETAALQSIEHENALLKRIEQVRAIIKDR